MFIDDLNDIDGADYYDGHSTLDDNYYQDMKSRLRERDSDGTNLGSMKYNDFKKDDTAGYGIFDQLGLKYEDRLCIDDDTEDDLSKRYEKIMAERQKDLNSVPMNSGKQVSNKNWR